MNKLPELRRKYMQVAKDDAKTLRSNSIVEKTEEQ